MLDIIPIHVKKRRFWAFFWFVGGPQERYPRSRGLPEPMGMWMRDEISGQMD